MKRMKLAAWTIFAIAILVMPGTVFADLYWESEQISQNVPNEPDGKSLVKYYVTESAMRSEMKDRTMIMDFDKKEIIELYPGAKTYRITKMSEVGMPPNAKSGGEATAAMQQMMQKVMGSIQVIPTNETRKIAGYNCTKYVVNFMMTNQEYWLSKDVKGYDELKKMGKKMKTAFQDNPMLKQMNAIGMMDRLDGFPVQTIMNMMGGTIKTTLKKVKQITLKKDMFSVPSGYKKAAK